MKLNVQMGAIVMAGVVLSSGCSTLGKTRTRDLNRMADNAVAKVVLEHPGVQAAMGISAGYIAIERSGSGIPMIGKRGVGVLVDRSNEERSYIRVSKLEVDGAWGVGDYFGFMLIKDAAQLKKAQTEGLRLDNAGTIFIYVKGESSAAYPIKVIELAPVEA
jgi:hypothetical protein